MSLSPREVKRYVANDLKARSFSRSTAAELLGMGKQTLSNLLSQQTYFSRGMARRFNDVFGYSVSFLMTGEGSEMASQEPPVKASPTAAFGGDDIYIDILEDNLETTIVILRSILPYCTDEEIRNVISNLAIRNSVLSQARKAACYIDNKDPEQDGLFIRDSLFNNLAIYDEKIKASLRKIRESEMIIKKDPKSAH